MEKIILAAVLGFVFTASARSESIFATAAKVSGEVNYAAPQSGVPVPLAAQTRIGAGGKISTGPGGSALLQLTPCSGVRLGASAIATVVDIQLIRKGDIVTTRSAELSLQSGTLFLATENTELRVNVPGGVITSRNGVFFVTLLAEGEARVAVLSGGAILTAESGRSFTIEGKGAGGIVGGQISAQDDAATEKDLASLSEFIDQAHTLGVVCNVTYRLVRAEFLAPAEREREKKRIKEENDDQPPVISPAGQP